MKISVFGKTLFEVKSGKSDHFINIGVNQVKESKFIPDFRTIGRGGNWDNPLSEYVLVSDSAGTGAVAVPIKDKKPKKEEKPPITPKGVYDLEMLHDKVFEINTDSEYVDGQIRDFKDKLSMIKSEEYDMRRGVEEIGSILFRMENRKKYAEYAEFFSQYPYTTNERVEKLLKDENHLQIGQLAQFIADMPKEAVQIMKEYNNQTQELCKKQAVFYIIADKKDFKKVTSRRDPILLAQSPFGHFWQILGAWDEEMLFLDNL